MSVSWLLPRMGLFGCYDLQGDFTQFSLGNGSDNYGVESCKYGFSSGNASTADCPGSTTTAWLPFSQTMP